MPFTYADEKLEVVTDSAKLREITNNYRSNSERPDDFVSQSDGTVIDKRTGLQWMRCSLGLTWTGEECSGYSDGYSVEQVKLQTFAGYDDWRLPTLWELETLVYCGGGQFISRTTKNELLKECDGDFSEPTIVQNIFPNTEAGWYWTSTLHTDENGDKGGAVVNFSLGDDSSYPITSKFQVRLVRVPANNKQK
ncbi:MAG: hypothetical protein CSA44_00800 [Gammaproteobacteria bacterium]|nr:MAG: hypothetical protein CSA44_00800 [Gammaproteobacteria bacterium]